MACLARSYIEMTRNIYVVPVKRAYIANYRLVYLSDTSPSFADPRSLWYQGLTRGSFFLSQGLLAAPLLPPRVRTLRRPTFPQGAVSGRSIGTCLTSLGNLPPFIPRI